MARRNDETPEVDPEDVVVEGDGSGDALPEVDPADPQQERVHEGDEGPAEPQDDPAPASTGDRLPIVRTNAQGHWWCPVCDHSHDSKIEKCRGCGAVRDGDEVTV